METQKDQATTTLSFGEARGLGLYLCDASGGISYGYTFALAYDPNDINKGFEGCVHPDGSPYRFSKRMKKLLVAKSVRTFADIALKKTLIKWQTILSTSPDITPQNLESALRSIEWWLRALRNSKAIPKPGREITLKWRVLAIMVNGSPVDLQKGNEPILPGPWIDPDATYLVVKAEDAEYSSI